ncbi:MAG: crossover junction endodeoxyribonuclease RuvC [Actinobacteria bacterium]|nr:crossover junction endodeoxyribonuclease RuvC [Actinomycetota bacterium]MCL6095936.1 crossover junction endodeoxyribonuclease RuvC [Actinomycetota bacterium]
MGVDPGLTRCGYGVLEWEGDENRSLHTSSTSTASTSSGAKVVAAGVISTDRDLTLPARLAQLQEEFSQLLKEFVPTVVVVERVVFQTNALTAMAVGQASGIALACAYRAGCQVVEYSANEVKMAVTGYGAADKISVQSMVSNLLKLTVEPKPPDVADALALALCHVFTLPFRKAADRATGIGRRHGM